MMVSPLITDGASQSARRPSASAQGSAFQDLLANDSGGGAQANSNVFDFSELGMLGSGQQANANLLPDLLPDPLPNPLPAALSERKAEAIVTPLYPDRVKDVQGAPAPPAPPSDPMGFEASTLSAGLVLLNAKADASMQAFVQPPMMELVTSEPSSLGASLGSFGIQQPDASLSDAGDPMMELEQALQPASGAQIESAAKNEASTVGLEPAEISSSPLDVPAYVSAESTENTFNVFLFGDGATAAITVVTEGATTHPLESLKGAAENVLKDAGWCLKSFKINGKYSEFEKGQGAY